MSSGKLDRSEEKDDLLVRIKTTKDTINLSDILENLTIEEVNYISGYIPELLKHRSWIIKTDALDIIAWGCLEQYENEVLAVLKNAKNHLVKKFALTAYFELVGEKAVPVLKEYVNDKQTLVRLTALSQLYILSEEKSILDQISKIVSRKNCFILNKAFVYNLIRNNFDASENPDLLSLLKQLLKYTDRKAWFAKEIRSYLRKIK